MRLSNGIECYHIDPLPGCAQVAVSHGMFLIKRERGKGLASAYHKERLGYMQEMLYDACICTTEASNTAQNRILVKNGWKPVHKFLSSKTDHEVMIWVRSLQEETT